MGLDGSHRPAATYALQGAAMGLGVLADIADAIPGPVKPIVSLAQRAITIAEVRRTFSSYLVLGP